MGNAIAKNTRLVTPTVIESLRRTFVVDIASGGEFSLCLTDSGILYAWGKGSEGQCGQGNRKSYFEPVEIEFDYTIREIVAGKNHCALITDSGQLFTWGFYKVFPISINLIQFILCYY